MTSLFGRAFLAVTDRRVVRTLFGASGPGRSLALRFVAGETLDDAVAVVARLNDQGMTASFDHLGEHVEDRSLAEAARDDYLACLDRIAGAGLDANISVKLTQLGMGLDDDLAAASLDGLAARALDAGTTVTVDMEESRYTEATIALYEAVQERRGNLGIALQSYLRRTPADLARILPLGGHIRLCKGAYREDAGAAFQRSSEVGEAYDALARTLMEAEHVRPAMATHDQDRLDLVCGLAASRAGPFEFQMLYGVRSDAQRALVAAGHDLRIYVPYGANWYPYLTRRIAERPANMRFFLRAAAGR